MGRAVFAYNDTNVITATKVRWAERAHEQITDAIRGRFVSLLLSNSSDTSVEEIFTKAASSVFELLTKFGEIYCPITSRLDEDTVVLYHREDGYPMVDLYRHEDHSIVGKSEDSPRRYLLATGQEKDIAKGKKVEYISTLFEPIHKTTAEYLSAGYDIPTVVKTHDHQQDGVGAYYTKGDTAVHFYVDDRYKYNVYDLGTVVDGMPWRDQYSVEDCINDISTAGLVSQETIDKHQLV